MNSIPGIDDIHTAAERIAPYTHRTPILTCRSINDAVNASVYFKCENFQKVGAFKARGALNTVLGLGDNEVARGVATHSSGNHAAALALAAGIRRIPAYVVMPDNTPQVKKDAVTTYGAQITYCTPTLAERENTLEKIIAETGAVFVPSFNDYRIIAGQATAMLEFNEDVNDLDIVMAPVGGGGLISGTALVAHYQDRDIDVIAAEPEGADDTFRSFREGKLLPSINPNTIADGLLTSLGDRTFNIIQDFVKDVVTVDDEAIINAMRQIWERMKIIIEPSAAVPVAALLQRKIDVSNKRVGIILSGGNVDLDRLPWLK